MPAADAPLLEVRGLSKRFAGVRAVDRATFDVAQGTITALIGPNGAGKSTLFNVVTGFERGDGGDVRFAGQSVYGRRPHRLVRAGMVRTFQLTKALAVMSVLDNMRLVHWFGVSIADLVQEPNRSPVQVVRADERRSVRLADERLSIQMLSADGNHAMMPVINTYDEGGGMADPTTHDGEEFVHVLDGHVELTVGRAEPIVLGPGDSAYYRSDVPHSFRNAGRGMWLLAERGIEVVEVPDDEFETMGPNVLALGPRRALALEGNDETRRRMERQGVDVLTYRGEEISRKGDGGPTCLTRPLLRA